MESNHSAILDDLEAVEDYLSKSYELTKEDKVSASLSTQDDIMEAMEVIRTARYALTIVEAIDEGVNKENEAEVGSYS